MNASDAFNSFDQVLNSSIQLITGHYADVVFGWWRLIMTHAQCAPESGQFLLFNLTVYHFEVGLL